MSRFLAALFVSGFLVALAPAEQIHPAVEAFKEWTNPLAGPGASERIKKMLSAEDFEKLEATGHRQAMEDAIGRMTGLSDPAAQAGATLRYDGGPEKGHLVIANKKGDASRLPVKRSGGRWVLDLVAWSEEMLSRGRLEATEAKMTRIRSALESYRVFAGNYPTEQQGLEALVERPRTAPEPKRWQRMFRTMPRDAWGQPFVYELVDQKNVRLRSLGPDRVRSDDDLVSEPSDPLDSYELVQSVEMPPRHPLDRYEQLWTDSLLTNPKVDQPDAKPGNQDAQPPAPERRPARVRRVPTPPRRGCQEPPETEPDHEAPADRSSAVGEANESERRSETDAKQHRPPTRNPVLAESQLEKLATREAMTCGLEIKRRQLQPQVEGLVCHQARIEYSVSGTEEALVRWVHQMHSPADFRGVTGLRLNPSRNDSSRIDARVSCVQWFVPEGGAYAGLVPDELLPLTEVRCAPLERLLSLSKSAPPNGLRFDRVEVVNQIEIGRNDTRFLSHVAVFGNAEELATISEFELNLKMNEALNQLGWLTPLPVENKRGGWSFRYQASRSAE